MLIGQHSRQAAVGAAICFVVPLISEFSLAKMRASSILYEGQVAFVLPTQTPVDRKTETADYEFLARFIFAAGEDWGGLLAILENADLKTQSSPETTRHTELPTQLIE